MSSTILDPKAILIPLCAQVALTFLVWIWMYYTRLTTMYKYKVNPQAYAAEDPKAVEIMKQVENPSYNFENLFEMPVLFYVAAMVIYVTDSLDQTFLYFAWAFVILRAVHSYVHCTCNRVTLRFSSYLFSSLALLAMWVKISLNVIG